MTCRGPVFGPVQLQRGPGGHGVEAELGMVRDRVQRHAACLAGMQPDRHRWRGPGVGGQADHVATGRKPDRRAGGAGEDAVDQHRAVWSADRLGRGGRQRHHDVAMRPRGQQPPGHRAAGQDGAGQQQLPPGQGTGARLHRGPQARRRPLADPARDLVRGGPRGVRVGARLGAWAGAGAERRQRPEGPRRHRRHGARPGRRRIRPAAGRRPARSVLAPAPARAAPSWPRPGPPRRRSRQTGPPASPAPGRRTGSGRPPAAASRRRRGTDREWPASRASGVWMETFGRTQVLVETTV